MGRPRTPLLSHERVVDTAFAIIDASGLDTLALERLADELGVKAPSLYYHFRDKAEILAEVARQVLLEAPIPPSREDDPGPSGSCRSACRRGRSSEAPQRRYPAPRVPRPRPARQPLRERRGLPRPQGIPVERHILILEGLETLTISGAVAEAATKAPDGSRTISPPSIRSPSRRSPRALDANPGRPDELFRQSVRSFLVGAAGDQPAPVGASRRRRRRPRRSRSPTPERLRGSRAAGPAGRRSARAGGLATLPLAIRGNGSEACTT